MKEAEQFGRRLRDLRIGSGLTLRELASKVNVDFSYLSKVENGVLPPPSDKVISGLAEVLGMDKNELLSLAGRAAAEERQALRKRALLEFGPKLRRLRIRARMSQRQLGERVNVAPTYLSKIENGTKPPPSMKVIARLAQALNADRDELLGLAGKRPMSGKKGGVSKLLKQFTGLPKLPVPVRPLLASVFGRDWAKVAISILLVIGIGASLWFAPTTARALSITFLPSPLPAGTLGSTYSFTVRMDIENTDLLPVKSVDLKIYNVANSAYYDKYTGLALADTGYISYATSGVGSAASIMADAASTWGYGYGYRYGYGYAEPGGWDTYQLGYGYGYGYGYSPYVGTTSMVYYVRWTPPSGWSSGDYKIKVDVNGNGTTFTQTSDAFTLSAPTPTRPSGAGGEPAPKPAAIDISNIVDEEGEFDRLTTLDSKDGNVYLSIPKGTIGLTEEGEPLSELSITQVVSPPKPPEGSSFIGLNYDLKPSGATFDPPVNLTFTYNAAWLPEGVDPESLTIAYFDEDTGMWVELGVEDITIDTEGNIISAEISHFTYFSVIAFVHPAEFTVTDLTISPAEVDIAQGVTISASVTNNGDLSGSYLLTLKIDDVEVSTKKAIIAGRTTEEVTFTVVKGAPGSYSVDVNGLSGTFTVKPAPVGPVVITQPLWKTPPPPAAPPAAPPAPVPPSVPAYPTPTPVNWLIVGIIAAVALIGVGIVVWMFGFRREY